MKLIHKYSLFLAMLVIISCAYGQENDSFSPKFRAAKMYVHSDADFDNNSQNFIELLRTFSPSIAWGNEYGNFHEIGIQDFMLSFHKDRKSFSSTIDYSYNVRMGKKNQERKVNFYAGAGARLGGSAYSYRSVITNQFSTSHNYMKLDLVITPRMTVKLSKNVLLDVNFPYAVGTLYRSGYNRDSPRIPVEDRKTSATGTRSFPNEFTVRVGVAIKF